MGSFFSFKEEDRFVYETNEQFERFFFSNQIKFYILETHEEITQQTKIDFLKSGYEIKKIGSSKLVVCGLNYFLNHLEKPRLLISV